MLPDARRQSRKAANERPTGGDARPLHEVEVDPEGEGEGEGEGEVEGVVYLDGRISLAEDKVS